MKQRFLQLSAKSRSRLGLTGTAIATSMLIGFISGCATETPTVLSSQIMPLENESIIVLGVEPESAAITIFPVEVSDDSVKTPSIRFPITSGRIPTEGFLVAKVSSTESLAIQDVFMKDKPGSKVGLYYSACGVKTMVFRPLPGKVVYAGTIRLVQSGEKLRPEYRDNFDSAKRYIDDNFPELKGRLVPIKFDLKVLKGIYCS